MLLIYFGHRLLTYLKKNEEKSHIPKTIEIKNSYSIKQMKKACKLAKYVLIQTSKIIKPGITTNEINNFVNLLCLQHGCYPSMLDFHGFPKSIITSVNDVAFYGVPNDIKLQNGDIINVDITIDLNGYFGDVSETYLVGDSVNYRGKKLVDISRKATMRAISICGPGVKFSEIAEEISSFVYSHGFDVIAEGVGHGIGRYFIGPPIVYHKPAKDNIDQGIMKPGMVFTIEPIISEKSPRIFCDDNSWNGRAIDNGRSAAFEHTILITKNGFEILTL